jgi:hypothetical protein
MMLPAIGAFRHADRAQTRLGSREFRLRLCIVTLRLLTILDGGAATFFQTELAVERLLGQRQHGAGFFVVGKSLREIAGVEDQKLLPLPDPFAKLDFQADDAPGNRRHNFDCPAGIGFDDCRQDEIAPDVLKRDRSDGECAAHR